MLKDLAILENDKDIDLNKVFNELKPGAYIFVLCRSNYHNTACDVEDSGFLIRDMISYVDVGGLISICLAIKPLSEKNFAENVMKWGTGGLNIDGTRIGTDKKVEGRYPANTIISEDIASVMDEQSGIRAAGHWAKTKVSGFEEFGNGTSEYLGVGNKSDKGGASRFFYNASSYKDLIQYLIKLGLPPYKSEVVTNIDLENNSDFKIHKI